MKLLNFKKINLILIYLYALYSDSLYEDKIVNIAYIEETLYALFNKKRADEIIKKWKVSSKYKK